MRHGLLRYSLRSPSGGRDMTVAGKRPNFLIITTDEE
ncbi:hypothetical protein MXAN_4522 [Myxococcus xanthus DK 1622]|uniref:Uncharacterized protein n=1 Tax=Myxococcus xanthus (strain DK1622) TaxID=246197 RepID=Q1D3T3_MYXXD|nr:hypothetical protein MXAN_4522 [Myxococcus xanthus DK 1622]